VSVRTANRRDVGHRPVVRIALALASILAALAAVEAAARVLDGYRVGVVRLQLRPERVRAQPAPSTPLQKWRGEADAWDSVRAAPVAAGVEREWFQSSPPAKLLPKPDTDLVQRATRYNSALDPNYEWNWNAVVRAVCRDEHRDQAVFNRFDDVFVFRPEGGTELPPFRFLQDATYPTYLQTNNFGWRGADIAVAKPPRTIRIAFIGASTTIGPHMEPYSYPELVGFWLARWARARHPELSFEVINAGREGIKSSSLQAIVRQELAPVDPDFVVYYEGANQFWPADFIAAPLPLRSSMSGPAADLLGSYSAIGRRLEGAVKRAVTPGSEPSKPRLAVSWPADIDENNPDLANPHLPIELPHILRDLDTIRDALSPGGGRLVMTSFMWLVYPGLVLDPARDADVFAYLNTTFWPFTYDHMRRFLDFQTRVFRKYAASHGLDFIDVDAQFPRDPRLFDDAIHMTRAGMHLQAWIVFNGLVAAIERELVAGRLSHAPRHAAASHPAFSGRDLVPMSEVRAACDMTTSGAAARR
jgi:hypothetical protein